MSVHVHNTYDWVDDRVDDGRIDELENERNATHKKGAFGYC